MTKTLCAIKTSFLRFILIALITMFSNSYLYANIGDEFSVGDFSYEVISNNTAKVIGRSNPPTKLEKMVIPGTVTDNNGTTYTVTEINELAFSGVTSLKSVTFSNGITIIGKEAFKYCTALSNVTLPETLRDISNEAFSSCHSLINISLPESLVSISDGAFKDCSKLTNLVFPKNLRTIGDNAFRDCNSLKKITISEGLNSIGYNTFLSCPALTEIYINETTPPTINESTFESSTSSTAKLYVPTGRTAVYKSAKGWRYFLNVIEHQVTGISAVKSVNNTTSETVIYTLDGKKVKNVRKGIYIINGKKMVH